MGKTTCAAARAIAEASAGARVLVVSTDPAHSLGDALGVRLTARPKRVGRFHAAELDAPRAFARWIGEHRAALSDALEHGTWLDRADVDALLELSLPGIDELAGMLEIGRLAEAPEARRRRASYDVVVVDTAPTGHTLRLLAAPETVAAVATVLDALQEEHRRIRRQLARVGRPEAADRLIALIAEQARDTGALLRDPARTTFCWVTLPETLSLAESEDGIAALEASGMDAAEVVVNRVLPPRDRDSQGAEGPCPVCDRRRAEERRVVVQIARRLGRRRRVRIVPADIKEPRGVAALGKIGRRLSTRKLSTRVPRALRGGEGVLSLPKDADTVPAESVDVVRGASLLFVGGKGGVGKTTAAAALAVRLARAHRQQRLLLLSTDPAHSVADVFEARPGTIGDAPRTIRGAPANLVVRELDAARALAARRGDLERALDEITAAVSAGSPGAVGRGAAELMDLAPPGIDELFGILTVVEAREEYDVIIVDTAPTGHALRLLELPGVAREWVQVLLRMLLKYKSLARPGQLAAELVEVSKSIRELQTLLSDRAHTRFLVVTRAADLPRLETERLLDRLRRLKLATPAIIVNAMTLAPGRCRRCRAIAAAERHPLAALRQRCRGRSRGCAIIQTPLSAPPPRGVRALEAWARRWLRADG